MHCAACSISFNEVLFITSKKRKMFEQLIIRGKLMMSSRARVGAGLFLGEIKRCKALL